MFEVALFLRSIDAGNTWTLISTYMLFWPFTLTVSRSNPKVMFMGGQDSSRGFYGAGVAMSRDGGATWTDISEQVDTEPWRYIKYMTIDPLKRS